MSSLKVSSTSYAVTAARHRHRHLRLLRHRRHPRHLPPPVELVSNGGFEASLAGWKWRTSARRSRVCTVAHGGSCSAELGRTRTGDATLDDSPNTVASTTAGAIYTASAWVRAPAGRTVTLRLRELSGATVVRSTCHAHRRRHLAAAHGARARAASGGTSLSVEIVASLVAGTKAQVDDVSLKSS